MTDRGSAAVEFALVIPLVFLVILGVAEVAVVAKGQLEVVHAAREGAREAATSPDPAVAVAAVKSALGEVGATARVTVRRPHVVGAVAVVEVAVPHRLAAPIFGGFAVELRGHASMRVEQ